MTSTATHTRRTSLYTATLDTPDLYEAVALAGIIGLTVQDSRPDQDRSVVGVRFPDDETASDAFARLGFPVLRITTGLGVHRREVTA